METSHSSPRPEQSSHPIPPQAPGFARRAATRLVPLICGLAAARLLLPLYPGNRIEGSEQVARKAAASMTVVSVAKAGREDLARSVSLAAEFRPFQEIDVHAKLAGFLKEILVDAGDRVSPGQLLATLEVPEQVQELAEAEAARRRKEADISRARGDVARAKAGYVALRLAYTRIAEVGKSRPNLLAQQDIDDAEAKSRVGEAQVSAAEASLAAAEEQLEAAKAAVEKMKTLMAYTRITAPFDAVVTRRYAHTGALIQAGTASQTQAMPIVHLCQESTLRLVVAVPESMVPSVHVGTPVNVLVPAMNAAFQLTVTRMADRVDLSTRTMEVEVDVKNPKLALMPGMIAYANITLESRQATLAIPVGTAFEHEGKPSVLVVNSKHTIEPRPVELGIETPEYVEVLSGLREGDLVVSAHQQELVAGQKVTPRLQETALLQEAH